MLETVYVGIVIVSKPGHESYEATHYGPNAQQVMSWLECTVDDMRSALVHELMAGYDFHIELTCNEPEFSVLLGHHCYER